MSKKRSAEGTQIERPKDRGGGLLPSRLGGLEERRKLSRRGPGQKRDPTKTVSVHIKRLRTPAVEGKLLKVIDKSRKKNLRIFLAGVACTPYAPSMALQRETFGERPA